MNEMRTGFAFVAIFAIGFGIIGWGVYCVFRSRKASGWPSVLGTMNACEIKKTSDVDGTTYRVHVGYAYEVYGRPYQGDRIAFGYSGSNKRAEHAALYDKLSMARYVGVRYDPSNPADSVLTYGLNLSTVRILVFGFMWVFFMIGFTALWNLSSWSTAWTAVSGLTLLVLPAAAIALLMLSRKKDKAILDRIEIR